MPVLELLLPAAAATGERALLPAHRDLAEGILVGVHDVGVAQVGGKHSLKDAVLACMGEMGGWVGWVGESEIQGSWTAETHARPVSGAPAALLDIAGLQSACAWCQQVCAWQVCAWLAAYLAPGLPHPEALSFR